MTARDQQKSGILAASGAQKAQLVLKFGCVLNVFTEDWEMADVAIENGRIVGIGSYEGIEEIDMTGKWICPGFIDGHIHLESSMVSSKIFEQIVVPHGTTAVVTDPHEIANVAGTEGIDYMLESSGQLALDVFFMMPSCVPTTALDENGAVLKAKELYPYYNHPRVLGLAELMNAFGTVNADDDILDKVLDAAHMGKVIDGHAPGLSGRALNAYAAAGVQSDHECSAAEEGIEKIRRGQWIMIREGTAAKNLEALLPLCRAPYDKRCMFVTDDKHPGDLLHSGHMDAIVRKAIRLGVEPVRALKMASFQAADYFGLSNRGAIAPGYLADLVILSDLENCTVESVFKNGEMTAQNGRLLHPSDMTASANELAQKYPRVFHSFNLKALTLRDFEICKHGSQLRAIQLIPGELLTNAVIADWSENNGLAPGVNLTEDIVKIAVIERHNATGHIGLGFLKGYGLRSGAIATSVAHDSHNLIVTGVNDTDMMIAANAVRDSEGGLAIVRDGKVLAQLPLPIAGLMTNESLQTVDAKMLEMKQLARTLGVPKGIDPFMTLAFVSLSVIPAIKIKTRGLIDTQTQTILESTLD